MTAADDVLLRDLTERLAAVEALPPAERIAALRAFVQRALRATLADGSWPDAVLLHEVLLAALDLVDATLADSPELGAGMSDADRRFLDAVRTSARSVELLDDMLADLRADMPPHGPTPPPF